jgi:diguanylate cyclase (GGDEF)-like protein
MSIEAEPIQEMSTRERHFADPEDLMDPEREAGRFDSSYLSEAVIFGWAIWAIYVIAVLVGLLPVHIEMFIASASWIFVMNMMAAWVYSQKRPIPLYDRTYLFLDLISAITAIIAVGDLDHPVWLVLVVLMLATSAELTDTVARVYSALCVAAYLGSAGVIAALGWSDPSAGIVIVTAIILALVGWNINLTFEGSRRLRRYIRRLSVTDPLTQVANRRSLSRLLASPPQVDHSLAVAIIDVDRFKQYNDEFGHLAGDRLLVRIAQTLKEGFPRAQIIARFGGDEFVMVLMGTSEKAVSEEIRRTMAERPIPIAVSIGSAIWPDEQPTLDAALALADDRLRLTKRGKRSEVPAGSLIP